jgi:hypothetical protein
MQPVTTPDTDATMPRAVPQWERALLAQWFAGTERTGPFAIAAAYVSERSRDNPRLRNMIVIAEREKATVSYLIHRPPGETVWVLTCGRTEAELGRFRTLPDALHMIRPPGASPDTHTPHAEAPMLSAPQGA